MARSIAGTVTAGVITPGVSLFSNSASVRDSMQGALWAGLEEFRAPSWLIARALWAAVNSSPTINTQWITRRSMINRCYCPPHAAVNRKLFFVIHS